MKTRMNQKYLKISLIVLAVLVSFVIYSCTKKSDQLNEKEKSQNQINENQADLKTDLKNGKETFVSVEEMPQFVGGEDAMIKYIVANTVYPPFARENGIQGKVFVRFVIDYEGNVCSVEAIRKVNPYLDKEAIRVVQQMPKWIPGKQKGQTVNVSFTVPINFRLQ